MFRTTLADLDAIHIKPCPTCRLGHGVMDLQAWEVVGKGEMEEVWRAVLEELVDLDRYLFQAHPIHPAYSVSNIQTKIRTLDGTKALSILNDEVIRIEARQPSQPTVLVAPAAQHPPSPSLHTNSSDQNSSTRRYQRSPWPSHHTPYPNWAWWNTPPCPYPSQPPWRPPTHPAQSSHPPPSQAQFAGFSDPPPPAYPQQPPNGYNALSPSDLSAAFTHMQLNPPPASWTSDIMDTGASSHLTHDPDSSFKASVMVLGSTWEIKHEWAQKLTSARSIMSAKPPKDN
ncbi:hypothetical protein E3N88_10124 [Mikania micrantha]|uniref:Uncharacterized protein n=1 Tax=Mikania micrantha TaxID=192012 RepID=A0A5N6P9Y3_9ASTR|nr:hypothetical protein E3N88_10124 [Mikania micrantha]